MAPRYTQDTREKIIKSQEPAPDLLKNHAKVAALLIKTGKESGCQSMIDRGWQMVVRVAMSNLKALEELNPEDIALLAETKKEFEEKIEMAQNG